ncbi:MAG: bifunctional biotin--[acetyl-CoA-carboxylase] ligase/biotin operon repressor BirA [Acidiferrobacterales bacterium]
MADIAGTASPSPGDIWYTLSMTTRAHILNLLADGQFHSGTEIGQSLGVSRAAINKAIKVLQVSGLEIHSVTGKGYKLTSPLVPLSQEKINQHLKKSHIKPASIHLLDEVDSTNAYLLNLSQTKTVSRHVCLSESQLQGRGRRGNSWVAPAYRNILLSVSWQFQLGPADLGGLSLAAGVAVANALLELGVNGVKLKWPNDILLADKKIGGLLIEMQGESTGPCLVVLGIGINVDMGHVTKNEINQPWTDLKNETSLSFDRNQLAASLIKHLLQAFADFEQNGFELFKKQWLSLHAYSNRNVKVIRGDQEYPGKITNIGNNGALYLLDEKGEEHCFVSGEVSLRSMS